MANSCNQILMQDANLYYNLGKFLEHIKKLFMTSRFKWEKIEVKLNSCKMIMLGKDLKNE